MQNGGQEFWRNGGAKHCFHRQGLVSHIFMMMLNCYCVSLGLEPFDPTSSLASGLYTLESYSVCCAISRLAEPWTPSFLDWKKVEHAFQITSYEGWWWLTPSIISLYRSLPSRVRSPTPAKTEKPPWPLATLLISSMISTVFPTPAPPNRPILPPFW